MTKPRAVVSASLAERGWREQWVNEEEAAALSGFSPDGFRHNIAELESAGFPRPNRWNGLRSAEAIAEFWRREAVRQAERPRRPSTRELETFNDNQSLGRTAT